MKPFSKIFALAFFLSVSALFAQEPAPVPTVDLRAGLQDALVTEPLALAKIDEFANTCVEMPDAGVGILRDFREKNAPKADALTAEIVWKIFTKKKWTDPLCELAAELLESPDPFAVSCADWALSIRTGWENSSETVPWSEDRAEKPSWFAKWLVFPAERFAELDYWRAVRNYGIQYNLQSMKGSGMNFLKRTNGMFAEILASPKLTPEKREEVTRLHAELEKVCAELQAAPDLWSARQSWTRVRKAARKVLLCNPDLDFQEILFTKRHSAHGLRNITGSQYPWTHKPGGDLCVKTGFDPEDPVRGILNGQLGPGHVHGTDLHWDGKRIVFGYAQQPVWPLPRPTHTGDAHWFFELRPQTPPIHLYEINLDGTGLHQITDDPYWGDFEPTYASDGSIVFASDRSGRSSECGNFHADHTVINLYRCEPDGSGLRRLSDNKDIDRYPHALSNGLIGYTRWEYQERHFMETHSFWTIHPDGTYAEAAYKQHIRVPWGLRDVRDIPGTNRYVGIAGGHHVLAHGQIVLFDLLGGPNDASRLTTLTPHITSGEGPSVKTTVPQGGLVDAVGRYAAPFPVSETAFLASWSACLPAHDGRMGGDTQFAIYLVDVYGNRELIHRERILSCDFATPVKVRSKPYELADGRIISGDPRWTRQENQSPSANYPHPVAYVADVNVGLPESERGKAKYLRVMQHVGWPLDEKIGAWRWAPGNAWDKIFGYWSWAPAREIGTVPVEEDGSCWFYLPENTAVYFQRLDENHLEIRRMRSHIALETGESRGCIGCHETRATVVSPKPGALAQAFRHAPLIPKEPAWGSENLYSYEKHIQPIFDRHCVQCHSPENQDAATAKAARFDLSGVTDPNTGMFRSYTSLFPQGEKSGALVSTEENMLMVSVSDKHSGAQITRPREFGSSRSRLIRQLLDEPQHAEKVRPTLSEDEWLLLVSWVDANAPYYDSFFNRRDPAHPVPARTVWTTFPVSIH